LDEIVTPDFPGNQHRVIGTRFGELIEQGHVLRWQFIEHAVPVLNDERIHKHSPLDPAGDFFGNLLYY
jgi:hypothetical protein